MKATKLHLTNFRAYEQLELEFEPDLTVLAGVNGVGKSSALLAVAKLLTQMLPHFTYSQAKPQTFEWDDIRHGTGFYDIDLRLGANGAEYIGRDFKYKQGDKNSQLADTAFTIMPPDESDQKKHTLLGVYYHVQRASLPLPRTLPDKAQSEPAAAYARALDGDRVDLRAFISWYVAQQELGLDRRDIISAVERAVTQMIPGFSKLTIELEPRPHMTLNKNGDVLHVGELSDGEKSLLAMVIDLARRMALANPEAKDPIGEGQAIVLIDEIEQHLHPSWQQEVLGRLQKTFPSAQFIVTTHSPKVLTEVEARCIRDLNRNKETGRVGCRRHAVAIGLETGDILERIMGVSRRNSAVSRKVTDIFRLIDQDAFDDAKAHIAALREELKGDIPDLVEADALLHMYSLPEEEE